MSEGGWVSGDDQVSGDRVSMDDWAYVVVVSWDGLGCGDVVCLDGCEDQASLHG